MTSEQQRKETQEKCKKFDAVDTSPAMHPFVAISVGELLAGTAQFYQGWLGFFQELNFVSYGSFPAQDILWFHSSMIYSQGFYLVDSIMYL